jgi:hypothetical protein
MGKIFFLPVSIVSGLIAGQIQEAVRRDLGCD